MGMIIAESLALTFIAMCVGGVIYACHRLYQEIKKDKKQ